MRTLILIVALSLTGCTLLTRPDGSTVSVLDTERLATTTGAASVIANTIFPGAGVVIQGIGGLLAMFGAMDRKKKLA